MGWFSGKQKIPISVLAVDIARPILSEISPENMKDLFGNYLPSQVINEQQIMEWLALNMFAVTNAAYKGIDSKALCSKFLDVFKGIVYSEVFYDEEKKLHFENLTQERYHFYFDCFLQEKADKALLKLGMYFSEKFAGEPSVVITTLVSGLITDRLIADSKLLSETTQTYDLI